MIKEIKNLNNTLFELEGKQTKKSMEELFQKIEKEKKLPFHKVYVVAPKSYFVIMSDIMLKKEIKFTGIEEDKGSVIIEI